MLFIVLSFIAGSLFGVLIMALCCAAKHNDAEYDYVKSYIDEQLFVHNYTSEDE